MQSRNTLNFYPPLVSSRWTPWNPSKQTARGPYLSQRRGGEALDRFSPLNGCSWRGRRTGVRPHRSMKSMREMVEDEQVVRIANCANAQPARMAYPGRALVLLLLLHFTIIHWRCCWLSAGPSVIWRAPWLSAPPCSCFWPLKLPWLLFRLAFGKWFQLEKRGKSFGFSVFSFQMSVFSFRGEDESRILLFYFQAASFIWLLE